MWIESRNNIETTTKQIYKQFDSIEFFKLLSRKEKYSEYIEKTPIKDQLITVLSELKELNEEVEKVVDKKIESNNENIRKELSDVLYTLFLSVTTMINQGILSMEDIKKMSKEHAEKIYQRCPTLLSWDKIDLEEEKKRWKAIKKQNGERVEEKDESF